MSNFICFGKFVYFSINLYIRGIYIMWVCKPDQSEIYKKKKCKSFWHVWLMKAPKEQNESESESESKSQRMGPTVMRDGKSCFYIATLILSSRHRKRQRVRENHNDIEIDNDNDDISKRLAWLLLFCTHLYIEGIHVYKYARILYIINTFSHTLCIIQLQTHAAFIFCYMCT